VQAHPLAALSDEEAAEPLGFGLLNTENCSFFFPLPHLGHSMGSDSERTSRSYVVSHSWQTYS